MLVQRRLTSAFVPCHQRLLRGINTASAVAGRPHYDVAVVGLGAMGAATALQATDRGLTVLGLDRYAPPHAMGSTSAETRITRLAVGEVRRTNRSDPCSAIQRTGANPRWPPS